MLVCAFLCAAAFSQDVGAPPDVTNAPEKPAPAPSPAAKETTEVVDGKVGFIYDLPEDWVAQDVKGPSSKVAFGRKQDGNPANITSSLISTSHTLDEDAANYLAALRANFEKKGYTRIEAVPQSKFDTASGQSGVRFIMQAVQGNGKTVRQTCYIFERKDGKKIGVICTAVDRGDNYDAAFDAIMKTFRVVK